MTSTAATIEQGPAEIAAERAEIERSRALSPSFPTPAHDGQVAVMAMAGGASWIRSERRIRIPAGAGSIRIVAEIEAAFRACASELVWDHAEHMGQPVAECSIALAFALPSGEAHMLSAPGSSWSEESQTFEPNGEPDFQAAACQAARRFRATCLATCS